MAVRSIIDIDVNDAAFNRFQQVWNTYQKALKSQPAYWNAINQHVNATRQTFDEMVISMAAANIQAKLREKAQERADRLTQSSAERWKLMARDTKEFARNIGNATLSLLKWGSITGVISGLVGAGGLFGIDRLAVGALQSGRRALGLGTTVGGQAAFGANTQQILEDPGSFLSAIAGAKYDVTQSVGLRSLTRGQVGGDTTDVAIAALRGLKREADSWNPQMFGPMLRAMQQGNLASPELLGTLRGTSPAQFEKLIQGLQNARPGLERQNQTQQAWNDLVTQLSNAGNKINAVLVNGLVGLAPGITKLSEAFAKVATVLLEKGGPLDRWITEFGGALEKFAGYVGTDDFQEKVKNFAEGVAAMAEAIGAFVERWGPKVRTAANVASGAGTIASIASDLAHGNIDLMGTGGAATKGQLIGDTAGMSPGLIMRLKAMAAAEGDINLTSGFRTAAEQEALRRNNPSGYPVAKGTSMHELGLAGDIKGSTAAIDAAMHAHAAKYGLRFPVKGDPVHVQMADRYQDSGAVPARNYTTFGRTTVTFTHAVGDSTPISVNATK